MRDWVTFRAMDTKIVENSGTQPSEPTEAMKAYPGLTQAGKGRPPGVLNKHTKGTRAMVLAALDAVGGQLYLQRQALANPQTFLALVAKTMPVKVVGDPDQPIEVHVTVSSRLRDVIEAGFERVGD